MSSRLKVRLENAHLQRAFSQMVKYMVILLKIFNLHISIEELLLYLMMRGLLVKKTKLKDV